VAPELGPPLGWAGALQGGAFHASTPEHFLESTFCRDIGRPCLAVHFAHQLISSSWVNGVSGTNTHEDPGSLHR
jgi:hypothetical protein